MKGVVTTLAELPPPPGPKIGPRDSSFFAITLVGFTWTIAVFCGIGALLALTSSTTAQVNPASLPAGHPYFGVVSTDGSVHTWIACPTPIDRAAGSVEPACQEAVGGGIGLALVLSWASTLGALAFVYARARRAVPGRRTWRRNLVLVFAVAPCASLVILGLATEPTATVLWTVCIITAAAPAIAVASRRTAHPTRSTTKGLPIPTVRAPLLPWSMSGPWWQPSAWWLQPRPLVIRGRTPVDAVLARIEDEVPPLTTSTSPPWAATAKLAEGTQLTVCLGDDEHGVRVDGLLQSEGSASTELRAWVHVRNGPFVLRSTVGMAFVAWLAVGGAFFAFAYGSVPWWPDRTLILLGGMVGATVTVHGLARAQKARVATVATTIDLLADALGGPAMSAPSPRGRQGALTVAHTDRARDPTPGHGARTRRSHGPGHAASRRSGGTRVAHRRGAGQCRRLDHRRLTNPQNWK